VNSNGRYTLDTFLEILDNRGAGYTFESSDLSQEVHVISLNLETDPHVENHEDEDQWA
jgi:hypothetical protein